MVQADCFKTSAKGDIYVLPKDAAFQELYANMTVLAEKVRAGKMSEAEAKLAFIEAKNRIIDRDIQNYTARSTAAANSAALNKSIQSNFPKTTNCTGYGNTVSCNTY